MSQNRNIPLILRLALMLIVSAIPVYLQPRPAPKPLSAREIADRVLPSVVLIVTLDENDRPVSQGSGFFYKPGLVVSNLHVYDRATGAVVKDVKTGKSYTAREIVGIDVANDLCVVRVDNAGIPAVALATSSDVRTGDEVYVASNPRGLEGSFTKGIVSSLRRDEGLIQIDAAISQGSSGGVLLNEKAEAIGVVKSSVVGGQNLNFAIPIQRLITLPLEFKHPIQLAGAIAYTTLKRMRLKGPVQKIVIKELPLDREKGLRVVGSTPIVLAEILFTRDGQLTQRTIYDERSGQMKYRIVRSYSPSGILTKEVYTGADGASRTSHPEFEDSIQFTVKNRNFSINEVGDRCTTTLDSRGNGIFTICGNQTVRAKFDDDGEEIEAVFYDGEKTEKIRRYSFKRDSYGNWTEKLVSILFPNSPPFDQKFMVWTGETEYREITYYK